MVRVTTQPTDTERSKYEMPTSRAEWQEYLEDLRTKAQSSTEESLHAPTTMDHVSVYERRAKIHITLYQAAATHYLAISRDPMQ